MATTRATEGDPGRAVARFLLSSNGTTVAAYFDQKYHDDEMAEILKVLCQLGLLNSEATLERSPRGDLHTIPKAPTKFILDDLPLA